MSNNLKTAIIFTLLFVVVFVVVHPLVDLAPTVVRHLQPWVLLFVAVVFVRILAPSHVGFGCHRFEPDDSASLCKTPSSHIDMTCTRLC
jgi:hypothetical protein